MRTKYLECNGEYYREEPGDDAWYRLTRHDSFPFFTWEPVCQDEDAWVDGHGSLVAPGDVPVVEFYV